LVDIKPVPEVKELVYDPAEGRTYKDPAVSKTVVLQILPNRGIRGPKQLFQCSRQLICLLYVM